MVGQRVWLLNLVGLLVLLSVACLLFLAFRVSDFGAAHIHDGYEVVAEFDNVGDLKPRAAVTIAGVKVGQVTQIVLDPKTFRAKVILYINQKYHNIPVDSSAHIFTAGILGSNYISISPGFESEYLRGGDVIENTYPAIILEELIGQFLFNLNHSESDGKEGNANG